MANIKLYPPFGTRDQSSSVKFEIIDIENDEIKVEIENVSDGVSVDIKHFEKTENGFGGVMDLNIPEHSSQSSVSIFFTIYKLLSDGSYEMLQICPSIFEIKEELDEIRGNIVVSPSFISQKDLCSIRVRGEPLSSTSFSVNDKILRVIINEAGYGSIHFKGSEVIGEELNTLNKIPIYVYEGENQTKKVFSGSYVNIIPSNLAVHADLDPRCDPNSDHYIVSGSWTRPEDCEDDPCDPLVEDCPCDPLVEDCPCNPLIEDCNGPCNPDVENCPCIGPNCGNRSNLPVRDCEYKNVKLKDSHCRIHNSSVVLLNNGMVMYAYTSPDKEYESQPEADQYNINRVFLAAQYTSVSPDIIAHRDVAVEPKVAAEDFRIHVDEDLWDAINAIGVLSNKQIYISFYNSAFGYQNVRIVNLEIDEYTGQFVIIAEAGVSNVELSNWIFCLNSVIFDNETVPEDNFYMAGEVPSNFMALPFVRNEFETGPYVQPVNVSIATNYQYVGINRETYVYIIVEAITENNLSQLYFNSMSFGKTDAFTQKTYGWVRLTDETQGNNRNPIAKMDSNNNLHVIFESDRGGINQLYYGNIGADNKLSAASIFSSSIDKYSEFLSKGKLPFDYFNPLLLKAATDQEYVPIPEYDTESILSEKWNSVYSNGGSVSLTDTVNYLDDIVITANPLSQEAMAITSLKILEDGDLAGSDPSRDLLSLLQYNYQISFDLEATITQSNNLTTSSIVSDIEMDQLFDQWKSTFTISIDNNLPNQSVYNGDDNNKFIIGRSDNIYDRIVPLVGSYKYDNPTNPSFVSSQIKILKNDNNLKDYTFGIMFEKTYLKATNIQTSSEYVSDGNLIDTYLSEISETIFTGKAKLVAFIRTNSSGENREDYIIVREFPEELDISDSATYDIITNYLRFESDQLSLQYYRVPALPDLYINCDDGGCPDVENTYTLTPGIDGITLRFATGTVSDAITVLNADNDDVILDTGMISYLTDNPYTVNLYTSAELLNVTKIKVVVTYNQSATTGLWYDLTEFVDAINDSDQNSYLGTVTLLINGVPKFSQSFISEIDTEDYNYFDIGFGIPNGGYYVADKMAPSKLGVYDNVSTTLDISNITISSPTYTYNDAVVSMPPTIRDMTKFKVFNNIFRKPANTSYYTQSDWEDNLISLNFFDKNEIKYLFEHEEYDGQDFEELFSVEDVEKVSIEFVTFGSGDRIIITTEYGTVLYDSSIVVSTTGSPLKFDVDVTFIDNIYITVELGPDEDNVSYQFVAYFKKVHNDNGFIQMPITYEGVNQSAALDMGICNDLHIAWQSNKSKYWDIYCSNSIDELAPFRHDTQITNTESNSIKPSIAVERTGKRMIVWNDNRDGDYSIYTARSLEGYSCDQKNCETKMLEKFAGHVEQCSIEFLVNVSEDGTYNLTLYMYSDITNSKLYKTITLEGNESRWFFNGVSSEGIVVNDADGNFLGVSLTGLTDYVVTYTPDKDDGIFDIILYARMSVVSVQEEV